MEDAKAYVSDIGGLETARSDIEIAQDPVQQPDACRETTTSDIECVDDAKSVGPVEETDVCGKTTSCDIEAPDMTSDPALSKTENEKGNPFLNIFARKKPVKKPDTSVHQMADTGNTQQNTTNAAKSTKIPSVLSKAQIFESFAKQKMNQPNRKVMPEDQNSILARIKKTGVSIFSLAPQQDVSESIFLDSIEEDTTNVSEILISLLAKEQEFVMKLKEFIDNLPANIEINKRSIFEIIGRLDLIYSYHDVLFLPDLHENKHSPRNIVSCFLKHKQLFVMYEDYYHNRPYMELFMMNHDKETFELCDNMLKVCYEQIKFYIDFLREIEENDKEFEPVSQALSVLEEITLTYKKYTEKNSEPYCVAEIIATEEKYINYLRFLEEYVMPHLKRSPMYVVNFDNIYGKTSEIYENQQVFYNELHRCIIDYSVKDVLSCFLKHEKCCFRLYEEDFKLKNNIVLLRQCTEDLQFNFRENINFSAPGNRIFKYKNILERVNKVSRANGNVIPEMGQVLEMFDDILNNANSLATLRDIKNSEVDLSTPGPMITNTKLCIKFNKKKYDGLVLLFQNVLLFVEEIAGSTPGNWIKTYRGHINTEDLGFNTGGKKDTLEVYFHKQSKDKRYILTEKSGQEGNVMELFKGIEKVLQQQALREARKIVRIST